MSNQNNFIYWDDMWNEKDPKDPKQNQCCGEWDSEGNCNCIKDK